MEFVTHTINVPKTQFNWEIKIHEVRLQWKNRFWSITSLFHTSLPLTILASHALPFSLSLCFILYSLCLRRVFSFWYTPVYMIWLTSISKISRLLNDNKPDTASYLVDNNADTAEIIVAFLYIPKWKNIRTKLNQGRRHDWHSSNRSIELYGTKFFLLSSL